MLTNDQKRQICEDLDVRCPVHRWQERADGSIEIATRNGVQVWTPEAKPKRRRSRKPSSTG